MKLNISITINLTEQEVLDMLTAALYAKMRYKDCITSSQQALQLCTKNSDIGPCYLVVWGERPEEPEKEKDELSMGEQPAYHAGAPGSPERPLNV